jgi:hypothetical protein
VTVAPQNVKAFEKTFDKLADEHCVTAIGHVAYGETLHIKGVLKQDVAALETAYKKTLKDY